MSEKQILKYKKKKKKQTNNNDNNINRGKIRS